MEERKGSSERTEKVGSTSFPTIRSRVAGIDIGSTQHYVCGPARADGESNVRVFGTTTAEINKLADWLVEQGVESAAMESTHVYWIPLYELLESRGVEPVLVNARQLHHVPGRKTDVSDCEWLQRLHSCGLLRGSFRPSENIVRLRTLHRQMVNLVGEQSRTVNWMQKALDQMNVQVHRAVTDLTGTTGMAIVRAIVLGERDPTRLAALRDRRCRKSEKEIAEHLTGHWREEHVFNLASALKLYDSLTEIIAGYESRLLEEVEALQPSERKDESVPPHPSPAKEKAIKARGEQETRATLWRFAGTDLTRIDGLSSGCAKIVLTEIGSDLSAFPTEKHFVSWLRLCPRMAISGGKPLKKKRNGLGANRVAGVLRMAALSLQRSKSALGALFRRTARYKGGAVAVFATARKLAQLVYRMLRYGQDYTDVGEAAYELKFQARRLIAINNAAKALGYSLTKQEETSVVPS